MQHALGPQEGSQTRVRPPPLIPQGAVITDTHTPTVCPGITISPTFSIPRHSAIFKDTGFRIPGTSCIFTGSGAGSAKHDLLPIVLPLSVGSKGAIVTDTSIYFYWLKWPLPLPLAPSRGHTYMARVPSNTAKARQSPMQTNPRQGIQTWRMIRPTPTLLMSGRRIWTGGSEQHATMSTESGPLFPLPFPARPVLF